MNIVQQFVSIAAKFFDLQEDGSIECETKADCPDDVLIIDKVDIIMKINKDGRRKMKLKTKLSLRQTTPFVSSVVYRGNHHHDLTIQQTDLLLLSLVRNLHKTNGKPS